MVGLSVVGFVESAAFAVEAFTAFGEILFVEFAAHIVEAHLVGGDAAALAPHHRVKDSVAGLGVMLEEPCVECNGFLCRVYLAEFIADVVAEHLGWLIERTPAILAHRGSEIKRLLFVPDDEVLVGREAKVIAAPYHLLLGNTEEFVEKLIHRGAFVPLLLRLLATERMAGNVYSIRRVGNSQLKRLVGQRPHIFEAVGVEYFTCHILEWWFVFIVVKRQVVVVLQ